MTATLWSSKWLSLGTREVSQEGLLTTQGRHTRSRRGPGGFVASELWALHPGRMETGWRPWNSVHVGKPPAVSMFRHT